MALWVLCRCHSDVLIYHTPFSGQATSYRVCATCYVARNNSDFVTLATFINLKMMIAKDASMWVTTLFMFAQLMNGKFYVMTLMNISFYIGVNCVIVCQLILEFVRCCECEDWMTPVTLHRKAYSLHRREIHIHRRDHYNKGWVHWTSWDFRTKNKFYHC